MRPILVLCLLAITMARAQFLGGGLDFDVVPPPAFDMPQMQQAIQQQQAVLLQQQQYATESANQAAPLQTGLVEESSMTRDEPAADAEAAAPADADAPPAVPGVLNQAAALNPKLHPAPIRVAAAGNNEEEDDTIERVAKGTATEQERQLGMINFDEKRKKEEADNAKVPSSDCAEDGKCVESELTAPGFKPGDETPEAKFSQSMMEIKDALLKKARGVAKQQAWMEEVEGTIKSYQAKLDKVKEKVTDERKVITALLDKREDLKKQQKQAELEARLKSASDQLKSLTEALTQVKDREDTFFETKTSLADKITVMEDSLAKLKGTTKEEMKADAEKRKKQMLEDEEKEMAKMLGDDEKEEKKEDADADKEVKSEVSKKQADDAKQAQNEDKLAKDQAAGTTAVPKLRELKHKIKSNTRKHH